MSSVDRTNKALQRLSFMGDWLQMKQKINSKQIMKDIEGFKHHWKPYNLRNPNNRWGLSITSLDGGFSGIPDLDSLKEYNDEHNVYIDEPDIKTKTPFYPYVESAIGKFKNHLGRTHLIKKYAGGQFPSHRDGYEREVPSFRLFLPIYRCNPPFNYFILDGKILHFEHGRLYYLNTLKEHIVFTSARGDKGHSMYMVANITLNEESTDLVLHNMESS